MAKGFNIRAYLGLETKDYEKGVARSKRQAAQLGSGIQRSVGGAFGSLKGMIDKFTGGMASAFTGITGGIRSGTRGMKLFGKAMIATGIGALIIAVTSLVTYFTKTERGGDKIAKVLGGLKGIMGALGTVFADVGEKMVDVFTKIKKQPDIIWKAIKENLLNRLTAIPKYFMSIATVGTNAFKLLGLQIKKIVADIPIIGKSINKADIEKQIAETKNAVVNGLKGVGSSVIQALTGVDAEGQAAFKKAVTDSVDYVKDKTKGSFAAGEAVAEMEKALKYRKRAFVITEQEIENEKAALRLKSKDTENATVEERRQALLDIQTLIRSQFAEKKSIMEDELAVLEANQALGTNITEDNEELVQKKAELLRLSQAESNELRTIVGQQKSITAEVESQAMAAEKLADQEAYDATELGTLEQKLRDLKQAQKELAGNSTELWQGYNDVIKKVTEEIDVFKTGSTDAADALIEKQEAVAGSIGGVGQAFSSMAESGIASAEDLGKATINAIKPVINALLIKAIAGMFSAEASKGVIGLAFAAAGTAVLTGVFSGLMGKFENGGIVGGQSYFGDSQTVRVNSGEMILNQKQQKNLFAMANGAGGAGGAGGNQQVEFKVKGTDLMAVINNNINKNNSYQ